MTMRRMLPFAVACLPPTLALLCSTAHAQSSMVAPDRLNRIPAVTIFCPSGNSVVPCNFGGSGSTTLTLGGTAISSTNRLPVSDSVLDSLLGAGSLPISGSLAISNFPSIQPISGAVSQSGSWSVGISSLPALPAGSNAIGSVSVSNLPATQPVSGSVAISNLPATQTISGAVTQSGTWSVGVSTLPALPAGTNAIGSVTVSNLPTTQPVSGSVTVSNLPATQAISATSLPLPTGAATAANQTAAQGTVAASAAPTNTNVIAGVYNSTLPSLTTGQSAAAQTDSSGRLIISPNYNLPVYLNAVASGGFTTSSTINNAASAMPTSVKAGAGMVYGYSICNSSSASLYFRFFNQNSAPTVGTSTPFTREIVPAGACIRFTTDIGMVFSNGIAFDITASSLADSDTGTIANANTVTAQIFYK